MANSSGVQAELAQKTAPRGASPRELVYAGFAILVYLFGMVVATGSMDLIVRRLWLDEIITWMLATDGSVAHMLAALLRGTDSNPPAYHLALWTIHAAGVPLDEVMLRVLAGTTASLGLCGVYACLRLVFNRIVSGAAVVLLLASLTVQLGPDDPAGTWILPGSILIRQAFEARFYGPWFAICAWFCYCLSVLRFRPQSLAARIALGVLTVLMLTIHYFGAFTFALIVAADWLTDRRPWRTRIMPRLPLLAAIAAVPVVAYFYVHQSRAFTVKSWIDPPTLHNTMQFLWQTWEIFPLMLVAAALAVQWMVRRWFKLRRASEPTEFSTLSGLLALVFLPVIILIFSLVVQPAGVSRYALPGVCGVAGLMALLLSRLARGAIAVLVACAVVITAVEIRRQTDDISQSPMELAYYMSRIDDVPADLPILFELRLDYYPAVKYYPRLGPRMWLLDVERGEVPDRCLAPSPAFVMVERDAQRAAGAFYPQFRALPQRSLGPGAHFILIAADANVERISARFGGARVRQVKARQFDVQLLP